MRGYETAYHLLKARQVRGQVCMTGDQWPLGTIRRLPNGLKQPRGHELTSWASCQHSRLTILRGILRDRSAAGAAIVIIIYCQRC